MRGFMVTGSEAIVSTPDNLYRGPARYNIWPLDNTGAEIDKRLNERFFELWAANQRNYMMLVNDWDFVSAYMHRCRQINIPTHLYWLSGDGSCPSFVSVFCDVPLKLQFCGWDYFGGCDQSYLFDDGSTIFCAEKNRLQGVCDRITAHGLFSSLEDAQRYAVSRKESPLKDGLEIVDDEYFLAVYELVWCC